MKYSYLHVVVVCILCASFCACGDKQNNRVPRKQISSDGSNDYKYIFKDEIKKEEEEQKRMTPDPFK